MFVPFGTGTSVITVPSVQRTGWERGRIVSTFALERGATNQLGVNSYEQFNRMGTHCLPFKPIGAYLGNGSRSARSARRYNGDGDWPGYVQAKSLATDGVEVRQGAQLVIRNLLAVLVLRFT